MDGLRIWGEVMAAVLGAVLGSFINVLAIRWHDGASIGGRSACPSCKMQIPARHLVPILSWVVLRGRCFNCQRRIHPQYVLVETAAAALGIIAAMRWDPLSASGAPHFFFELFVTLGLLVPVVMDLRWQEIPVEYVLGLGAIGAIIRAVIAGPADALSVLSWTGVAVCAVTIFFGGQVLLSRERWLGSGDMWLGIGMAGLLGLRDVAIAIYLAYIIGGTLAMVGMAVRAFKRRARLPFAPALVAGTMGAVWFGETIASWVSHAFI